LSDLALRNPLTRLRLIVALATLTVWVTLLTTLSRGASVRADLLHSLCLLAIAVGTYAWVFYPTAWSLFINAALVIPLAWSWALGRLPGLGLDVTAFVALAAVAGLQRQQRARRFKRMAQLVEDLREERTVKEQAGELARQTCEALRKKLSRYTQLQHIAEELSKLTDREAIAQLAVERVFSLIGKSDVCLLFLIDPDLQELSLVASKKRGVVSSIRAKHGDQFDRHVLRTQRPLLVNDVRRDFRFTTTLSTDRSVSSVIACPLLVGQNAEGVLRLDSATPGAYTQDDLRFLDILLDLVATAMTNAHLFAQTQRLAVTDGLTGLLLRRPFLEQLTRELLRSGRSREPVSVLMLDVDHFKAYNDSFGHTAGDLVLKTVAQVLRETAPPDGICARYGGEEFALLLSRTKRLAASDTAERIRRAVEQRFLQAPYRDRGAVTVSLGVATFPEDAQAELELIRVADQRLYQAKRAGRNLVCAS
jgi:diguanylate cyclase (GGDEF)-like protein